MNGQWRSRLVFLAAVMLSAILLCLVMALIAPGTLDLYHSLLTTTLAAMVFAAVYAYRSNLANIFITLGLFVGSLVFLPTTDYIFNSILKQHQRDRILSFLGIISDPLGTDYNVNQAKIAIGSGNFWGKGFLEGTHGQIKIVAPFFVGGFCRKPKFRCPVVRRRRRLRFSAFRLFADRKSTRLNSSHSRASRMPSSA